MKAELICVYVNAEGGASVQVLKNLKKHHDDRYIQGWSVNHLAPRTLRVERIIDTFDSVDAAESFLNDPTNDLTHNLVTPTPRLYPTKTFDIHFTGFKKADKTDLTKIAEDAGMVVRKEVTKYLDILCYGYNAGPKKLEKAMTQGVMILNRHQLENFIETGEVPEMA